MRVRITSPEPWPDPVLIEAGMTPPQRDDRPADNGAAQE
jgi:hypothetical protein